MPATPVAHDTLPDGVVTMSVAWNQNNRRVTDLLFANSTPRTVRATITNPALPAGQVVVTVPAGTPSHVVPVPYNLRWGVSTDSPWEGDQIIEPNGTAVPYGYQVG